MKLKQCIGLTHVTVLGLTFSLVTQGKEKREGTFIALEHLLTNIPGQPRCRYLVPDTFSWLFFWLGEAKGTFCSVFNSECPLCFSSLCFSFLLPSLFFSDLSRTEQVRFSMLRGEKLYHSRQCHSWLTPLTFVTFGLCRLPSGQR